MKQKSIRIYQGVSHISDCIQGEGIRHSKNHYEMSIQVDWEQGYKVTGGRGETFNEARLNGLADLLMRKKQLTIDRVQEVLQASIDNDKEN